MKKKKSHPIGYKICKSFSVKKGECKKGEDEASECRKKCVQPIFARGKRGRKPYPDFVKKEIRGMAKKHPKWSLRKIADRYVFVHKGIIKQLSHATVAKIIRGVKRKKKRRKE